MSLSSKTEALSLNLPNIFCFNIPISHKDQILSNLEEFAFKDLMASFLIANTTSDFLFIRPSGNPIDAQGFAEMRSSGDLVLETAEITKVHKFDFFVTTLLCVYSLWVQSLLIKGLQIMICQQ